MNKTSKKASSAVRKSRKGSANTRKLDASSDSLAAARVMRPKAPSKQQQVAELVVRDEGATLDEMIAVTGWLSHTTRAALTGLKKKGYVISSDKVNGVRTYRAVAPE